MISHEKKSYNNIHTIIKNIKFKNKITNIKEKNKKNKSYLNVVASEAEKRKEKQIDKAC